MSRLPRFHVIYGLAALVALLVGAHRAAAQTDEIQVYDAGIAPVGAVNLTLHNNYTPSGIHDPAFPAAIVSDKSLNGTAEWAYGVAPWMEAGLYFPLYSITRNGGVTYDGMKLRALFVTPDAAKRQFFYGINFEFSFNTAHWDTRKYTSEIRPIVGAHLGRIDLIFNPILDNSWNGVSKLEFVPSTRVALALTERYKVALEEYDDFGALSRFLPSRQQSHQLFAVVDVNTPWVGIEAGVGAGLTPASDHWTVKPDIEQGPLNHAGFGATVIAICSPSARMRRYWLPSPRSSSWSRNCNNERSQRSSMTRRASSSHCSRRRVHAVTALLNTSYSSATRRLS